jgi:CBS domain-containing protein
MSLGESLEEPVSRYMSRKFTKVNSDENIYHAAEVMRDNGTTETVVVEHDAPVGIFTERDVLYKVVASGLYPRIVKAKDIMSAPLETVESTTTVASAIQKMSTLGIRRLGVTQAGKIVGMITQKAIVSGGSGQVPLPELATPDSFTCPYCNAVVKTREELSKHIDRTHMGGAGLLEGNTSKW